MSRCERCESPMHAMDASISMLCSRCKSELKSAKTYYDADVPRTLSRRGTDIKGRPGRSPAIVSGSAEMGNDGDG